MISISDEQVRIALKVWFQDEEFEGGDSSMRDMRAAIETALGIASPPAVSDGNVSECLEACR